MFETNYIANTPVVKIPESLDIDNIEYLLHAVHHEATCGRRVIVLDFDETFLLDSTALATLIKLYKSLRVGEGDLLFINIGEEVSEILRITHLDQVFTAHLSAIDALSARDQCLTSAS